MKRLYESLINTHIPTQRQMLFLMGSRQVGKTTSCNKAAQALGEAHYLNWDNQTHRQLLLQGPDAIAKAIQLERLRAQKPTVVFDELHKYSQWKTLLKGWFDSYHQQAHTLVTGSARLDVYRVGGDSLLGRYLSYRMHPLSVAELIDATLPPDSLIRPPQAIDDDVYSILLDYGGFPEPFTQRNARFSRQCQRLRNRQLLREDIRDLTRIQELGQIETLALILQQRIGRLTPYSSLAGEVNTAVTTVKRWLETLQALYFCFAVRPWHKNIERALRKEPVYYLWDWSQVKDSGMRAENFIACALLKAVQFWTDHGYGEFALHFMRDKDKREVDFVVVHDGEPWFLVEAKRSAKARLSPNLAYFQDKLKIPHAFQVALDAEYVDQDCFSIKKPIIVPARTLLSQLV